VTDRDEIEALRQAKEELVERFGDRPWFRGAGIAPSESGLVLRVNVDPDVEVDDAVPVPERLRGFPVEVIHIKGYAPRQEEETARRQLSAAAEVEEESTDDPLE